MFSVTLHLETSGSSSEKEWTSTCHGLWLLEAIISVSCGSDEKHGDSFYTCAHCSSVCKGTFARAEY